MRVFLPIINLHPADVLAVTVVTSGCVCVLVELMGGVDGWRRGMVLIDCGVEDGVDDGFNRRCCSMVFKINGTPGVDTFNT